MGVKQTSGGHASMSAYDAKRIIRQSWPGDARGLNSHRYFSFTLEVTDWITIEAILSASSRSLM